LNVQRKRVNQRLTLFVFSGQIPSSSWIFGVTLSTLTLYLFLILYVCLSESRLWISIKFKVGEVIFRVKRKVHSTIPSHSQQPLLGMEETSMSQLTGAEMKNILQGVISSEGNNSNSETDRLTTHEK